MPSKDDIVKSKVVKPTFSDLINQRNQLLKDHKSTDTKPEKDAITEELQENYTALTNNVAEDFTNSTKNKNTTELFNLKTTILLKIEEKPNDLIPHSKELAEIKERESLKLKPETNTSSGFKEKAKNAIGNFQFSLTKIKNKLSARLSNSSTPSSTKPSNPSRNSKEDRP